jgi:hypothetical protein
MELLILDALLRPIDVVDEFVSVIWTERFAELGDFELVVPSTTANRKRLDAGTILAINESKRLMRVRKVEDKEDEDNGSVLKITGPEFSTIIRERVLFSMDDDRVVDKWYGHLLNPAHIARLMFFSICKDGVVSPDDIIPFLQAWGETLYEPGTIPEPTDEIMWEQEPVDLYEAIKNIIDPYDLGFRLYKDPEQQKLYFDIYAGSDRTTLQTELDPVVFAPDLENLQNTTELHDSTEEYNVVQVLYIYKPEVAEGEPEPLYPNVDWVTVTDPNADTSSGGLARKVKVIKITTIPDGTLEAEIPAYMTQLGLEELAKSRPIRVFDGEIDQYSSYLYERDYFLGDIVEVRNANGATAFMRVDEQIFVEDAEGERSYPSLITKEFASPGTWASWKYDIEWSAVPDTEFWVNQ